jgi:beta-glucosidase
VKCENTDSFAEAVTAAQNADLSIVVLGESADMSGEATSRAIIELPGRQTDLIKAIQATGKPTVVVLLNGRPLTINWIAENTPAILESWFPGTEGGNAIADVLFGDVSPGGKLPVTFPRYVGQIPLYYNHLNTGRPPDPEKKYSSKYLDMPVTPLFPFGFGLSYTEFQVSNLQLSSPSIQTNGKLTVSVDVRNTGKRTGDEVVQLYIRDVVASVARPVKELKGFERVTLQPGETRHVTFTLSQRELGFHNRDMQFVVEPGTFNVTVGTSSVDDRLASKFEVTR